MKNKITILFTGILVTVISAVKAQTTDTVKSTGWMRHDVAGAAQIQVTYRKGNTLQLNQDLGRVGIPPVNSNDLWINLSMSHYMHHWVMEDGLGFTPVATSAVNNLKAHYNQYQAFFRLGYNFSQSTDYRIYPFVGANFSASVLNIEDKARQQNVTDFTQELLNSTSSKTFYQPNFGIELGAGFDYQIKLRSKKMDCFEIQRSIPVGIRAGYYFNTYASDWKIDNYALNNGPSQKQSAVFLTFNIGLGYEVKK